MLMRLFESLGRALGFGKNESYYPLAAVSGDTRLYVGNLSYGAKEEEVDKLFSKYGKVRNINIVRDRVTRRLKGYAFIEMSREDATKALALSGTDFLGRKIVVSEAKVKKQDSGNRRPRNNFRRRRGPGPRSGGYKGTEKPSIPRYE